MNRIFTACAVLLLCILSAKQGTAQFNLKKAVSGASKTVQAVTLTDEQMANYVKEYIDWTDKHNQVCADDDSYTVRLKKLTEGLTEVEGIPLNFKVYHVTDINAFACADGSVRIFSALMDIMSDEELLSKHGYLGTFVIRVQHRQHSSWQGRITWLDKNKTLYFRSVWEMVKMIASALAEVKDDEGESEESWTEE